MNIEIDIRQALALQEIIADKHAGALRIANNADMSDCIRFRNAEIADVCLDVLNKLAQELFDHV